MSTKQPPAISIVVACRNEAAHIRGFLDSLLAQEMGGVEWEVVIADGISDDGTREILEGYSAREARFRILSNPGRIVSTGLNAAIRAARGGIILRMDAHTRYAPDYCRRCVETLQRTDSENAGGPARTEAHGTRARAIAAAYHSPFSCGGARFHDETYEGCVDTVPYGCWRKETLLQLGLFDETLVRNQDDELNLRLVRNGGKIWQDPAIESWYTPRSSLSAVFRQYFQYGFWKVAVIRKHCLPASWRHLVPMMFVLENAILLASMAVTFAGGAADWFRLAALLWLAPASIYASATLFASLMAAAQHGWRILPYLPATFLVFHLSYGLGFSAGLIWFLRPARRRPLSGESVFARITR